ncbi:hypothetical protein Tc00.1047053506665.10 [Trypanosoma cruzi]|uniref:Uncharacterized protein n=1 Tax=Trypanosoma cruzi (strain CL Brener) TaxID=353153 RepID=Q4CND4_TRYCC|nr:hypothetical protein Tc00.1047053506665.10 [Trypanosoma cruzi]EAN81784.1 hypothetical protein Tc00.1047053506665.10 [Trypanosoma cruzi]|eukprot:XP_803230.1 hypothetical protein [Trypanosoma cruzi strain CL Brener]
MTLGNGNRLDGPGCPPHIPQARPTEMRHARASEGTRKNALFGGFSVFLCSISFLLLRLSHALQTRFLGMFGAKCAEVWMTFSPRNLLPNNVSIAFRRHQRIEPQYHLLG